MIQLGSLLVERGHSVMLVSRGHIGNHPIDEAAFQAAGIRHTVLPFPSPLFSPCGIADAWRSRGLVLKLVDEVKPDLIHVHWPVTIPYAELVWRRCRVPYITAWHHLNLKRTPLDRMIFRVGQRAVAVSNYVAKRLISDLRVSPGRISVIPNGVDPEHFRPPTPEERRGARRLFGVPENSVVLCVVGSLYRIKRHDLAISAMAEVTQEGMEVFLLIAGTGPERARLEVMVQRGNLNDRVRFLGYADARTVFWASDIQVAPSDQEAYSQVAAEGMLAGVPIIRTPSGGAEEQVIEGETGLLAGFGNATELAARVRMLCTDVDARRRMAAGARRHAEKHLTAVAMVNAYEAVYQEVVVGGRSHEGVA